MAIRFYTESDIENILKIISDIERTPSFNWGRSEISDELKLASTLVSEVEGRAVAFLSYRDGLDFFEITVLATAAGYRRHGLLAALLQHLQGVSTAQQKRILLEVHYENTAAISLYKKMQFQQFSVRRQYYGDGADALIFQFIGQ